MRSKIIVGFSLAFISFGVLASRVFAAVDPDNLQASTQIGQISNLGQMFTFAFNLLRYIGWAGVIVGVGLAIFALIYKLFGTESEETMKTVSGYITKAVIIVICGILLLSAGFVVKTIAGLLGSGATFEIPVEIGGGGAATPPRMCPAPCAAGVCLSDP